MKIKIFHSCLCSNFREITNLDHVFMTFLVWASDLSLSLYVWILVVFWFQFYLYFDCVLDVFFENLISEPEVTKCYLWRSFAIWKRYKMFMIKFERTILIEQKRQLITSIEVQKKRGLFIPFRIHWQFLNDIFFFRMDYSCDERICIWFSHGDSALTRFCIYNCIFIVMASLKQQPNMLFFWENFQNFPVPVFVRFMFDSWGPLSQKFGIIKFTEVPFWIENLEMTKKFFFTMTSENSNDRHTCQHKIFQMKCCKKVLWNCLKNLPDGF